MLNLKNKLNSNIQKIPIPEKLNCEEKARELIPPYLILPNEYNNFWKDGTNIGLNNPNVRKGSGVGENINKLYFDGNLTYSKEIISEDGTILGTRSFIVHPTIEKYENKFNLNHTLKFYNETRSNGRRTEVKIYVDVNLFWTGFNEEIKNIFRIEELNVTFVRDVIKFTYTINKESGTLNFRFDVINWTDIYYNEENAYMSRYIENIIINPPPYYYSKPSEQRGFFIWKTYSLPIMDSNVYKIVGFDIYDCKWVE